MENGEYLITEDCKELRRQVELTKEEKIEEINLHCDALFKKISTYQEKCLKKYKEMSQSKQLTNELIKLVNDSIQKQNVYLNQLTIDDKETMACNQKMNDLKIQIGNRRKNIKKTIFENQIMKFQRNTASIDEEFLGNLIQTCMFSFSVISYKYISI